MAVELSDRTPVRPDDEGRWIAAAQAGDRNAFARLVEAYWGDETQGGRRKYYRITDAGQAVYRDNVRAWVVTRGIIDSLLDLDGRPGSRDPRPGRQRA